MSEHFNKSFVIKVGPPPVRKPRPLVSASLPAGQSKSKPGPKGKITAEVAQHIAEAVGQGLTLQYACDAEEVTVDAWHKATKANPDFSSLMKVEKAKFLRQAITRLANHFDPKWLTWLLVRRHSDLFQHLPDVNQTNTVNVSQLPAEVVSRARELAKARATKPKPADVSSSRQ